MWRNLWLWLSGRGARHAEEETAFGYLGVVKPLLGVFIGISAIEIPCVDLIIRHVVPWEPARWIFLGFGVWGLLWMFGLWGGMKVHPHLLGPTGIRVRLNDNPDFTIPWADVETVAKRHRSMPSGKSVQFEAAGDSRVLHIVVASQTSIDVRLRRPMAFKLPNGMSEPVHEVRIFADDADGFVRAARESLVGKA